MRTILFVGGILVAIFSAFMVAAAIGDLVYGSETEPGVLWGLLVFFTLTLLAGGYLSHSMRRGRKMKMGEMSERRVLEVIIAKGGRLTPMELAAATHLSFAESRDALDKLIQDGMGEVQVTEGGEVVYSFRGVVSDTDKATGKNPLAA